MQWNIRIIELEVQNKVTSCNVQSIDEIEVV